MAVHRWRPDPDDPISVGRCDKSNFIVPRDELVRQMEWRGDRLVWTGFMVWSRFADAPNPQLRPPKLGADPVPLQFPGPRPDEASPGDDWVVGEGVDGSFFFLDTGADAAGLPQPLLWQD